jgi:predicted nucleic acid-binding protein
VTALSADPNPRICATAIVEAAILLGAAKQALVRLHLDQAITHLNLTVVPFTESDWYEAVTTYGRLKSAPDGGRRPTLGLCFSAAVATKTGAELVTS